MGLDYRLTNTNNHQPTTKNTMKTTITNTYTGYSKTIITKDFPSVSTIARHVRASKASDCKSITSIYIDGIRHDLIDLGRGLTLTQHQ